MPKPLLNNIKAQRSLPKVFACTGLGTRDSAVFTQTDTTPTSCRTLLLHRGLLAVRT